VGKRGGSRERKVEWWCGAPDQFSPQGRPSSPRLSSFRPSFPDFPLPISQLSTMSFQFSACEPPTASSLADARRLLDESNTSLANVDRKIEAAEAQLAQIVADSRCAIKQLQCERTSLEEKIARTLAYMSPIRRLPAELLRHIFIMNFEEYPCCAWILSSVCSQWRRLALSMPKLWSKVWYPSPSTFTPGFSPWELCGPSLGISRTSPLISPLSLPVLSRYRKSVRERSSTVSQSSRLLGFICQ
jgi:F-box-like